MSETKKPKAPPTTIGTLHKIQKLLAAHSPAERTKILAFLTEEK